MLRNSQNQKSEQHYIAHLKDCGMGLPDIVFGDISNMIQKLISTNTGV